MTNLADEKNTARKQAFAARKTAHAKGADAAACAQLHSLLDTYDPGKIIAAYMPIRTEISPLPVMVALSSEARTICVPVIQGAGMPLRFSVWTPDAPMSEGPFGASVPATDRFVAPDILITPLVAFDRHGYRLGYGGGFYDRSFEELKKLKPTLGIGFAYAAQELPKIPVEPTDQRLDAIVTEKSVMRF